MELTKLTDPFTPDEIEWRIGRAGLKKDGSVWATALVYVEARAIQDRLDAVVGPFNWRVTHQHVVVGSEIKGVMCEISIKDPSGVWVSKSDGAEPTDFEPFKGGISSALKRAAVLWGIGRYLYKLDETFVSIVDRSTEGAKYAKHKDKRSNQDLEFYWVAPKLPNWAIPADKPADRKAGEDVPKAKETSGPITGLIQWTPEQKREYLNARFGTTDFRKLSLADQETVAALSKSQPFRVAMSNLGSKT